MNMILKERDEAGRFVAGHSWRSNPTRAMLNREFRACASSADVQELYRLWWALCHDADPKVSLAAIVSLADRLMGRPDAKIEVEQQPDLNEFAHLTTQEIIAELAKSQGLGLVELAGP